MNSTTLFLLAGMAALLTMVITTVISFRLHNSKAERIYGNLQGIEEAFTGVNALVEELSVRHMAVGVISEEATRVLQEGASVPQRLRPLLELTSRLLSEETPIRVRILNLADGSLSPLVDYVPTAVEAFRGSSFRPGEGAVGLAYESASPVLIENINNSDLFAERHSSVAHYQSVLCVPIPTIGQPVAVLNLDAPTPGFFVEEHVVILRTVCNFLYALLREIKDSGGNTP